MISLRIAELLEEKNLTRYWLAQQTGIKYQTINGYYKNKIVRYDSYILDKICQALHCTPADLFYYDDKKS